MERLRRLLPPLALTAACLLCAALAHFFSQPRGADAATAGAAQPATARCFAFPIFNTQATLTLYDPPGPAVNAAVRDILDRLSELHRTVNAYDPDSELSRLNATAAHTPFACSPLLWDILLRAEQAWTLSDHLFDATVGPLLKLWGFRTKQGQLPSDDDIQAARRLVGFDKLILDRQQHTVRFPSDGMSLDFGGIAKGYALHLAIDIARQHGLQAFLIDLGGNIFCSETHLPPLDAYTVGVRNPRDHDRTVATVTLAGQCVATSGNYERFRIIQGQRIGHIMDPRTGRPAAPPQHYEGVTAVTTDPTLSDVCSTTAFVGGPDVAAKLAERLPGSSFIFVSFDDSGNPIVQKF